MNLVPNWVVYDNQNPVLPREKRFFSAKLAETCSSFRKVSGSSASTSSSKHASPKSNYVNTTDTHTCSLIIEFLTEAGKRE